MTENCRFVLDGGRYVIDLLNPANSGKTYCHEGDPEDDIYLRERVLMALLDKRLAKLIHDGQPKVKDWRDGKEYQPYNHDQHAVWPSSLCDMCGRIFGKSIVVPRITTTCSQSAFRKAVASATPSGRPECVPRTNSGSAFGRFDLILSHLESTPMSLCAFVRGA